jgi:PAS domain S-box-containing protein
MSEKGNPSEESLRLLLDRSPVVAYRYRLVPDRAFKYVNATAERLSGYTPDEFYADPEIGERLTHPDDRSVLLELLRAGWQSGPRVSRWIRKDGGQIWVEQTTVSVHDEHGVLVALEGMVRQIDDPTTGPLASIRTVGGIRIELVERRAYVDRREVDLTPAEFKLLVPGAGGHRPRRRLPLRGGLTERQSFERLPDGHLEVAAAGWTSAVELHDQLVERLRLIGREALAPGRPDPLAELRVVDVAGEPPRQEPDEPVLRAHGHRRRAGRRRRAAQP